MSTEADTTHYSEFVKEMVNHFNVLTKDHKELQELGFGEIIPLLSESYFTGETNDEKLEEFLNSFDNVELRKNIKSKLVELKEKANKKIQAIQAAKKKPKETPKEAKESKESKEAPKEKEKGKIFDRIEVSTPKNNEAPKKRVKVDKQKEGQPRQDKKPQEQMQGEDGQPQVQKKEGLKKQLQKEGKQKCRFYPFCKNIDNCQYFHPTEKCKYFPNCKHGDNCLYLHEGCRFKEKCTKPGCPYVHPFKSKSFCHVCVENNNIFEEMMRGYLQSQNHPFKSKKKAPKNPGQGQGQAQQKQDQN